MTVRELRALLPACIEAATAARHIVIYDREREEYRKIVGVFEPADGDEPFQLVIDESESGDGE